MCIGAWDAYFYIGTPILIEMVKISLFAWDAYFSNRMPIFTLRRGNVTQIRKKASMKRLLKRNLAAYGFWQVIICVTNYNLPPSYQFFKSLHIFPFIQPLPINRVLHHKRLQSQAYRGIARVISKHAYCYHKDQTRRHAACPQTNISFVHQIRCSQVLPGYPHSSAGAYVLH